MYSKIRSLPLPSRFLQFSYYKLNMCLDFSGNYARHKVNIISSALMRAETADVTYEASATILTKI